MYAIVEMAGQQFKVSKDQKVFVHRLDDAEGSEVIFDKVLLLDQNGAITIGAPTIDGASVQAKVLRHVKGDKVIVFKKKRRKGYKVKNGHRQLFTEIQIEEIRTILVEASKTLAHLDPQTWAQQAKLAADGKWDELKKWQDELNGGIVK